MTGFCRWLRWSYVRNGFTGKWKMMFGTLLGAQPCKTHSNLVTISVIAYKAELAYITEIADLGMDVAKQTLMGRK